MQSDIRRRGNGTIDIEHYRSLAESMRHEASIDIMRNARPTLWAMAACGMLLLALVVFGRHQSMPQQLVQLSPAARAP